MNDRNLSINRHYNALAAAHRPRCRFEGSSREDWRRWALELRAELRVSLGNMPPRVPLNSEILIEWRDDGLIKQRLVFDVEEGLSVTAYLFRPEQIDGPLPGILACHGHGPFGKEPVMGNDSSPELQANIQSHHYDYGLQMAKAGFAVMAIDFRGFGERDDRRSPHFHDVTWGRDQCNVHALRDQLLGRTLLGMNLHDAQCALDYLAQQGFVDPARLGVMGLSFGGTMATWIALTDERIKAADIICYSARFADFAMRSADFCGNQITPGLYALCDVPDLHGLIAPRPLLVEIGIHDEVFHIDSAMSCFREVEKIYAAAGAREKLELDLFGGGHRWGGNKLAAFFKHSL
jgi:dienelactone hydrolase